MVDKIMVLNEGQVADFGSYDELISKDGPFAQILKSFIQEDRDSDCEEDLEGKYVSIKLHHQILHGRSCINEFILPVGEKS